MFPSLQKILCSFAAFPAPLIPPGHHSDPGRGSADCPGADPVFPLSESEYWFKKKESSVVNLPCPPSLPSFSLVNVLLSLPQASFTSSLRGQVPFAALGR